MGHSGVACATCVAIAIARGHVRCLRALLTEGHLENEWLWLPALHVTSSEGQEGEDFYFETFILEDLLRVWRCLPRCPHRLNRKSSSHKTVSIDREYQCEHVRSSMNREEELLCVTRPAHSAFFAFSLTRLALNSKVQQIRDYFLRSMTINMREPIWDHSGYLLEETEKPLRDGPL